MGRASVSARYVSCPSGYTWNYWDLCKCVANGGGGGGDDDLHPHFK